VVEGCCESRRVISKTEFRLAGLGLGRVFGVLALREGLIKGNCASDICEAVHVSELPSRLFWRMCQKALILGPRSWYIPVC
jgi:hypothetical protein